MAASKSYFPRQSHRFLPGDPLLRSPLPPDSAFELDESDLYSSSPVAALSNSPDFRRSGAGSRFGNRSAAERAFSGTPSSLPVNIPNWSKILKDEYRENRRRDMEEEEEGGDEAEGDDFDGGRRRVPPHEFLARTRMASFSVHEGVGRTLKGRDLSRVRNAIWEKTGYQD